MASVKKKFTRVKRIVQELKELEKNTNYEMYLEEANEFDTVRVVMPGPSESLYEGGYYVIRIHFGPDYPYKSPSVGILNKIYHPNVDWGSGSVCFNALNHDWKECYTLFQMMTTLLPFLLRTPNGSDPLNQEAGLLCEKCPDQYTSLVKEMVGKHALLHQLEPLLKGMYDWRTKKPFHPNASPLASVKTTNDNKNNNNNNNNNKSQQGSGDDEKSKKKEENVSKTKLNIGATGSKKCLPKNADDSDGIDDNALLDSSDSEREENKKKKMAIDKAKSNNDKEKEKEKEKENQLMKTNDEQIVTKELETLCIGVNSNSLTNNNNNNNNNNNEDEKEEKKSNEKQVIETNISLPPPINTQKFNQWWSRSSSSASLSSFELLRRCKSEVIESRDYSKKEKEKEKEQNFEDEMETDLHCDLKKEDEKTENLKSIRRMAKMGHYLLSSKSACNSPQLNNQTLYRDKDFATTTTQSPSPNFNYTRRKMTTRKLLSKESSTKTKGNKLFDKIRGHKPPPPSYPRPKHLDDKERKQKSESKSIKIDEMIEKEKEKEKKKEEWSDFRNSEDDDNDLSSLDEDPISCVERQKEMESLMKTSLYSRPYVSSERSISPFLTPMYASLNRREQTEIHLSMTPQPPLPDRYDSVLNTTLPTMNRSHSTSNSGRYGGNDYLNDDHIHSNAANMQTWTRHTAKHKQIDRHFSPTITVLTKKS